MGARTGTMVKVTIIGDGGIGKTWLLNKLLELNLDKDAYEATQVETYDAKWDVGQHGDQRFDFYDTAGQEVYETLRLNVLPGTNILLIGFNVAVEESFDNITAKWLPEFDSVEDQCQFKIIIGMQYDRVLESGEKYLGKYEDGEAKKAWEEKIKSVVHQVGACSLVMTSAQQGLEYGLTQSESEADTFMVDSGVFLKDEIIKACNMHLDNQRPKLPMEFGQCLSAQKSAEPPAPPPTKPEEPAPPPPKPEQPG